jgi:ABC-type multidrug transport system fused ATPase/permease subunit
MTGDPDAPEKIEIDWTRAIAGAMAAVASAVLLSTLGAAGTILGAAIGSLVVTIASAMFAQGLSTRQRKRRQARRHRAASSKVGSAQAEVLRAMRVDDPAARDSRLEHASEQLADAREELEEELAEENAEELEEASGVTSPLGWRERLTRLRWKRIALTALAVFVMSLVLITAFELLAGSSVSSLTGGSDSGDTTIGQVGGGNSGDGDQQDPEDQPTGSPHPSETAEESGQPTESAPPPVTASASPTAPTAPTASPTTTPLLTAGPTTAPSATP